MSTLPNYSGFTAAGSSVGNRATKSAIGVATMDTRGKLSQCATIQHFLVNQKPMENNFEFESYDTQTQLLRLKNQNTRVTLAEIVPETVQYLFGKDKLPDMENTMKHTIAEPNLPVYDELPEGRQNIFNSLPDLQTAFVSNTTGNSTYTLCPHCQGWVPGMPYEETVNTLSSLTGRNGTIFLCRRCGQEIAFMGMIA